MDHYSIGYIHLEKKVSMVNINLFVQIINDLLAIRYLLIYPFCLKKEGFHYQEFNSSLIINFITHISINAIKFREIY